MMYDSDRNGVERQVKDRERLPRDGWRSGSSSDTVKPEKAVAKEKVRVRLVQVEGKIKPVRMQ